LIQLLKSGWLILSSQPRRAFYAFLSVCQGFVLRSFQRISSNFKHLTRFDLSLAGGEFYSVSNRCQPPFSPLSSRFLRSFVEALLRLLTLVNLLINKRFTVSTAPEVGRIIDRSETPSTPKWHFIQL
jgi:hypothetical protein